MPYATSLADIKEGIKIDRFQQVSRTSAYAKLSRNLKDSVAAHLLSSQYIFTAPTIDSIRAKSRESLSKQKQTFYDESTLLTRLIRGGASSVESIFKVEGKGAQLFHELNETVKDDLLSLLFDSWWQLERDSWLSTYSQQAVSIGERGLYAMVCEREASALEFLKTLHVDRFSQADLRIIMYSLLEGGSMNDASELGKRSKYLNRLIRSELFTKASSPVQTQLLQLSRIPAVGRTDSKETLDIREHVSEVFDKAIKLENTSAYIVSLARLYERLRMEWFLSVGSPVLFYTPFSPFPRLAPDSFEKIRLWGLSPDNTSAKHLDDVRISPERFGVSDAITIDYNLFPHRDFRATLGGQGSRRWFTDEDARFQAEAVHVKFDDQHQFLLRIPAVQTASNDARPPILPMAISALGLVHRDLRSQAGDIFILPFPRALKDRSGSVLAFYRSTDHTIRFLHIKDDESWKENFDPAGTMFHEFGHLIFFKILRMADRNNPLLAEYRSAVAADRADVSRYGQTSLSEDFAESLELLQLLPYVPNVDVESSFDVLFPNRKAFFLKHLRGYLSL